MKNHSVKKDNGIEKGVLSAALVLLLALVATIAFAFDDNINCVDRYSYVNKRFACFERHVIDKKDYRELRGQLLDYIKDEKEKGNVDVVSIFFRDLESGPTMGIDERIDFVPASLLKLPNALILMRLQEEGEINPDTHKLSYTTRDAQSGAAQNSANNVGYEIKPNTPYTVSELIFRSLAYSDNVANKLLINYIESMDNGRNLFLEIYRDLGIIEVDDTVTAAVNTKGYSTIFRMLYNSSFLHPENSEMLLEIMSHSLDVGGLAAGVPKGVRVAHKYGERVLGEGGNQLHDCGIVYYPQNPYMLCVMTRGRDLQKLQGIITSISQKVYQEFDSRKLE